jgi:hypothetical protein
MPTCIVEIINWVVAVVNRNLNQRDMSTVTLSASFLNLDIFYQDIPVFDFFLRERKYTGKKCTDTIYKKALAWESQTTWA